MKDIEIANLKSQINQLQSELQHQKGMFWIIGEIIKNATNISSFQELMKIITDMLMGVMGVSSCYLWIYNGEDEYTLHFRSIFLRNRYVETSADYLPDFLTNVADAQSFQDPNITKPLIEGTPLPGSRLAAPLYNFQRKSPMGYLIVEHEASNFFKESTSLLFETLAIFIGSNSYNSKLFETVTLETESDPLTNVYNRKFLSRYLKEYVPTTTPLSFCIFDIDSFKYINDIYGHEKGDKLLVEIAQAALSIMTPLGGDVIRYGGDEFILLLEAPLKKSIPVLNEIRRLIPTLPIMSHLYSPVTITMGAAEYPGDTSNINNLLAIADNALLRGKALGKNVLEVG